MPLSSVVGHYDDRLLNDSTATSCQCKDSHATVMTFWPQSWHLGYCCNSQAHVMTVSATVMTVSPLSWHPGRCQDCQATVTPWHYTVSLQGGVLQEGGRGRWPQAAWVPGYMEGPGGGTSSIPGIRVIANNVFNIVSAIFIIIGQTAYSPYWGNMVLKYVRGDGQSFPSTYDKCHQ